MSAEFRSKFDQIIDEVKKSVTASIRHSIWRKLDRHKPELYDLFAIEFNTQRYQDNATTELFFPSADEQNEMLQQMKENVADQTCDSFGAAINAQADALFNVYAKTLGESLVNWDSSNQI